MNIIKEYRFVLAGIVAITAAMLPSTVFAYVGPGAGLSAIGSLIALIGAVLLALVGFIWFPVKRLWKKLTNKSAPTDASANNSHRDD